MSKPKFTIHIECDADGLIAIGQAFGGKPKGTWQIIVEPRGAGPGAPGTVTTATAPENVTVAEDDGTSNAAGALQNPDGPLKAKVDEHPTDAEERTAIQEVEAAEEARIAKEAEVRKASDEEAAERDKEPAKKKRSRRKAPPRDEPEEPEAEQSAPPAGEGGSLDDLPDGIRGAAKFKDLLKALLHEGYGPEDMLVECERLKELGHKAVARVVNLKARVERTLAALEVAE